MVKDKKFRSLLTGKIYLASEFGKTAYEETWKEQKESGVIPEDSSDFDKPNVLSKEDYIEIGLSYLEDNEDYEEVKD